jgi:hypothetical protein
MSISFCLDNSNIFNPTHDKEMCCKHKAKVRNIQALTFFLNPLLAIRIRLDSMS